MIIHKGGIPTLRHNEIRELMAELLVETASGVSTEPRLQALHDEVFQLQSANREDETRLNVRASNFWCKGQEAFLTSGFSTRSPPPTAKRTSSLCFKCMNWKRNGSMLRGYEKLSVEPSTPWFLRPLEVWPKSVPSVLRELLTFYHILHSIRCCISFSLLHSAIRAIRGSRQSRRPAGDCGIDFNRAYTEGHLGP